MNAILIFVERQSAIILLFCVQVMCLVVGLARIAILTLFSLVSEVQNVLYAAQDWLQAILLPPSPAAPATSSPMSETAIELDVKSDGEDG